MRSIPRCDVRPAMEYAESHWAPVEGDTDTKPTFVIPRKGLKTHDLGHGRTKLAVPAQQANNY